MADSTTVSEATVYRLSLYHCWLGELLRSDKMGRVTSRELSEQLGVKEETVRRDLSFVGGSGRPGSGYEAVTLFDAIQEFLGLSDAYPVIRIGTAQMLDSLSVVFPPDAYGVLPVGYFSELPEDAGRVVNGITVKHLTDLPELDPALGVSVAMVACSPSWVPLTLELLDKAGISGVLLLTPQIRLNKPESMNIIHVRMPCDIKSLACQCNRTGITKSPSGVLPAIGDVQSR